MEQLQLHTTLSTSCRQVLGPSAQPAMLRITADEPSFSHNQTQHVDP